MNVTLLYTPDCPHRTDMETLARQALEALEIDGRIETVAVETRSQADELGFPGSPTILLDGEDPFAGQAGPVTLGCRVYRTELGFEGTPTATQLRLALRDHMARSGSGSVFA